MCMMLHTHTHASTHTHTGSLVDAMPAVGFHNREAIALSVPLNFIAHVSVSLTRTYCSACVGRKGERLHRMYMRSAIRYQVSLLQHLQ